MNQVLVFDLGGVLVENDMFSALRALMACEVSEADLKARWLASSAGREFELGLCSPQHFGQAIVSEFELPITPDEFLLAFAGWPRGLSEESLVLLAELGMRHTIACLSNSNELHWTDKLTGPFQKSYSSHLIKRIKPDADAFDYVTKDLGVEPGEIVFFDDSQPNVDAALEFGWQAHLAVGLQELKRVVERLSL